MGKGDAWWNCEFVAITREDNDRASFLKDKEELNAWLKDGSLDQDDYVVEIKKLWKVEKETIVKRYIMEAES